ncbi:MAG: hypothetical protein QXW79_01230 [Thermoplasmata archaeon]
MITYIIRMEYLDDEQYENDTNSEYGCLDDERDLIMEQIDKLYVSVFERFRKGELMIFNPNVFLRLTRERFISWIIENNEEVREILS